MRKLFFWLLGILALTATTSSVRALDYGYNAAAANTGLRNQSVEVLAGNMIKIVLGFVGIIFLLLIIYAGFQWMVGGREGNEESIKKAKTVLSGATVGLVIIVTAYSITYYITKYLLAANS